MKYGDAFAGEFFNWFKHAKDVTIEFFPISAFSIRQKAVVNGINKIVAWMFAAKWAVDFDVEDFADVFNIPFHSCP